MSDAAAALEELAAEGGGPAASHEEIATSADAGAAASAPSSAPQWYRGKPPDHDEVPIQSLSTDAVEIEEFEEDQELVPCELCGRQFLSSRLEKHSKVCAKQQKRRKTFAPDEARVKLREAAPQEHKKAVRQSSWKQQHEAFQQAVRGAKLGEQGADAAPVDDGRIDCPHCNRKFAPNAAERHIPACKEKALRGRGRNRGGKPKR